MPAKSSSLTTTRAGRFEPIHPGEVLFEDFLKPLGLSQYRLARSVGVPPRRINEIVLGKRAVSANTALRLARFFGTSAEFWMNLQVRYDLEIARDSADEWLVSQVKVFVRENPESAE